MVHISCRSFLLELVSAGRQIEWHRLGEDNPASLRRDLIAGMNMASVKPLLAPGMEAPIGCFHGPCPSRDAQPKLKKCANCGIAQYCSVDCQKADWAIHRPHCRRSRAVMEHRVSMGTDALPEPGVAADDPEADRAARLKALWLAQRHIGQTLREWVVDNLNHLIRGALVHRRTVDPSHNGLLCQVDMAYASSDEAFASLGVHVVHGAHGIMPAHGWFHLTPEDVAVAEEGAWHSDRCCLDAAVW